MPLPVIRLSCHFPLWRNLPIWAGAFLISFLAGIYTGLNSIVTTERKERVDSMSIDWNFIDELEGKELIVGYVPVDKKGNVIGKSGVTISTGFDLGQYGQEEIVEMFQTLFNPVSSGVIKKFTMYAGVKGKEAVQLLKQHPLVLTEKQAKEVAEAVRGHFMIKLAQKWNEYSFVNFYNLPDEMQTVLFSLSYNFGLGLFNKLPNTMKTFKTAAETKNYRLVYAWMEGFPSKNPELKKRRMKEAFLLKKLLSIHRG